jgi:hypothetical protein
MFSNFGKSFTFLLLGCLCAFCAADVFAQNKQPEQIPSLESSSEISNPSPDAEVRADSGKSQTDDPSNAQRSVQTIENGKKIISEDISDVEKEKPKLLNFNRQREINDFRSNFSPTKERKRRFIFDDAATIDGKRFSFRSPLAASSDDEKNSALPGKAANAQNGKADGFHWRLAIGQSLMFLAVQHGYAFTQPKTREAIKGKFWKDYIHSVKSLSRWDDGGRFFTNYIAHPMQGSFTGFIYVQNDPKGLKQQFGASGDYWRSRLKAMAWSAAWSTQFEIGPVSQASIGNVGLKGKQTWGDIVVTPTVGTAMLVSEDAIDRFVMKRIERSTGNFYVRIFARMLLSPTRTIANLFRFKEPWYRDRPLEH